MKIVIKNNRERDSGVYFLSQKDIDDFDFMMYVLFLPQNNHLFDEDAEPVGEEFIAAVAAIQPDTWNPEVFIEWFNKQNCGEYRATLEF